MKGSDQTKNVLFSKIEGRKMFCKEKSWDAWLFFLRDPPASKSIPENREEVTAQLDLV
jgi:hypothetical protein